MVKGNCLIIWNNIMYGFRVGMGTFSEILNDYAFYEVLTLGHARHTLAGKSWSVF